MLEYDELLRRYCDALECVQELRTYVRQAMPLFTGATWSGARAALIRSGIGAELPQYSEEQKSNFIDWDEERRRYQAEHGIQGVLPLDCRAAVDNVPAAGAGLAETEDV